MATIPPERFGGYDPTDLGPIEPARPDMAGTIRFRDATDSSGIGLVHQSGNSPAKIYPTANGSGVALLDYDGDGRLDVYLATTRELPLDVPSDCNGNRLYRNLGVGRFEDVTESAGVGFRGFTHGVAAADLDDDGLTDLYLCNLGGNRLYLNNGDGTFRDATEGSGAGIGPWTSGAAPLDYNSDGLLDLYVTCYGEWPQSGHAEIGDRGVSTYASPTQIEPARHYLLRGLGGGRFEDATGAAGILRRDGRGLGVVAADVDGDGRVDLYVANDMAPNFLFLNNGDGSFRDASELSGAALSEAGHAQAGMGVDAEDVDGDGLPELFVTNFREDYHTLYRNLGAGLFQDVSAGAGLIKDSMPDVGWGCALADFDNDSHVDLLVVNGHVDDNLAIVTGLDIPQAERPKLWRNDGHGRFALVPDAGPVFETPMVARGAAVGDLDDDGDLDVVACRMDDRPLILLNESPPRSWIRLDLRTGPGRRPAIGAAVAVHLGDRVLRRQVKGGGSYLGTNDPRILVGLGDATRVDRVEISWPGGGRSILTRPELNRTHRLIASDRPEEPAP